MSTRKQQRKAAEREKREAKLERRMKVWNGTKTVGTSIINLMLFLTSPLWIGFLFWFVAVAEVVKDGKRSGLGRWATGKDWILQ